MKANTPILTPTAAAVVRREVGSEPDPPNSAASLAVTHFPPVHVVSAAQSLSAEHVADDAADAPTVLDATGISVNVALAMEIVVSISRRDRKSVV